MHYNLRNLVEQIKIRMDRQTDEPTDRQTYTPDIKSLQATPNKLSASHKCCVKIILQDMKLICIRSICRVHCKPLRKKGLEKHAQIPSVFPFSTDALAL